MPTTPTYNLRTPELSNANNVPLDLASLATQVDTAIKSVEQKLGMKVRVGRYSLRFSNPVNGGTGASGNFSFSSGSGSAEGFASPPTVFLQIATLAGGTNKMIVRVDQASTSAQSCPIHITTGDGSTINSGTHLVLNWIAIGN